jgi:hypothetical protein
MTAWGPRNTNPIGTDFTRIFTINTRIGIRSLASVS